MYYRHYIIYIIIIHYLQVESLVNITSDKLHHILVPQKFMRVGPDDKPMELLKYIKPKIANREQVIIFNNTNNTCNWVSMFLDKSKIETVRLNGDMPLYERQNKYASFKSGRCCVLCTTNAGSRGMDTVMIRHVLNYDFPNATADYIHRYLIICTICLVSYKSCVYYTYSIYGILRATIHYMIFSDVVEPEESAALRIVE